MPPSTRAPIDISTRQFPIAFLLARFAASMATAPVQPPPHRQPSAEAPRGRCGLYCDLCERHPCMRAEGHEGSRPPHFGGCRCAASLRGDPCRPGVTSAPLLAAGPPPPQAADARCEHCDLRGRLLADCRACSAWVCRDCYTYTRGENWNPICRRCVAAAPPSFRRTARITPSVIRLRRHASHSQVPPTLAPSSRRTAGPPAPRTRQVRQRRFLQFEADETSCSGVCDECFERPERCHGSDNHAGPCVCSECQSRATARFVSEMAGHDISDAGARCEICLVRNGHPLLCCVVCSRWICVPCSMATVIGRVCDDCSGVNPALDIARAAVIEGQVAAVAEASAGAPP